MCMNWGSLSAAGSCDLRQCSYPSVESAVVILLSTNLGRGNSAVMGTHVTNNVMILGSCATIYIYIYTHNLIL